MLGFLRILFAVHVQSILAS